MKDYILKLDNEKETIITATSYKFDCEIKKWLKCKREIFTFVLMNKNTKENFTYDILWPECQIIRFNYDIDSIRVDRNATLLTKTLFKKFKKTIEYQSIPKELRIENL